MSTRIAPTEIHFQLFTGGYLTEPEVEIRAALSRMPAASIDLPDQNLSVLQMNAHGGSNGRPPVEIAVRVSSFCLQRLSCLQRQKHVQSEKGACAGRFIPKNK